MTISVLEQQLKAELLRIENQRRIIIEDLGKGEMTAEDPNHWRYKDGTFVLVPLIVARTNVMLALAIERDRRKRTG